MTGIPTDATLLVAGGTRVDAGKTTFSTGLLARLRADGDDATGVKPRAGNDFWFDHDDVRKSLADDRLYGKDARRLAAASDGPLDHSGGPRGHSDRPSGLSDRPSGLSDGVAGTESGGFAPERINPIHRLWRPTPGRTGLLGEEDRTFLVDRVGPAGDPLFVVNGVAADAGLVPEPVFEHLPLEEAPRVRSVPAFNDLMRDHHVPALDGLADRVGAASGPVVVESYGDVAAPLAVEVDAVAVVDPGRARVYDGDRYETAREVAAGSAREGQLEEHTDAVTEMVEPLATVGLPALASDERSDPGRVADAYSAAYDALLDPI